MPQQLEFVFGPRDATPEEQKEWIDGELEWWGKYQLKIVALMALVQVGMFGFMLLSFYTIGELVK